MAKIGPPPENAGNQPSTLYSVGLSPVKTLFEAIETVKEEAPSSFSSIRLLTMLA
jgi:hypothetical protein